MQMIHIVSNRLPTSISKKNNKLSFKPSAGGLATGLGSLYKKYDSLWLGWPGIIPTNDDEKNEIKKNLVQDRMSPVFLGKDDIEKYYEGFSNNTIWPLFHYFTQYTHYHQDQWEAYVKVNNIFCDELIDKIRRDDIIWIHDYHLLLLPQMIRERIPDATIGFFLHIPFPSFEIFRLLPWRKEILAGLLGADLIGFHTFDYGRHFMSAVTRIAGHEVKMNRITHEDRVTQVDCFPMGIDFDKFAAAPKKQAVQREKKKFLKRLTSSKIIISIDRLDYSKGLLQRLEAYDMFLRENPEYLEKIVLIMVVVPSRSQVANYQDLKHQIDEMVGRINGEHGSVGWIPIVYLYRSFSFNALSALYSIADIALITPLRDGMNLVAKEFIANKKDDKGVLIMSELAGSADELGEAILINPNDQRDIVEALKHALVMPEEEQIKRNLEMQHKIKRYNVKRWAEDFVERLVQAKELQNSLKIKQLSANSTRKIVTSYKEAEKRLIFLDYDGTLVPFFKNPLDAKPDNELLEILKALAADSRNSVVIISGRSQEIIEEWFGELEIDLVAEHGVWLRELGHTWEMIDSLSQDWKKDINPILDLYVERTPGSFVEEKGYSLVWHYRKADVGLGELRARELIDTLNYFTGNLDLQILEGNKVIEIKNSGINKGRAAIKWINREEWPFIIGIGDDWTDEDLFSAMPDQAFSIRVGFVSTLAKHNIKSYIQVRKLLRDMID